MEAEAVRVDIGVGDTTGLLEFAKREAIDLTVVGPEYPLTLGIVDIFREHDLRIFGPTAAAARLEGSKAFAKEVMVAAGVPTAAYSVLTDLISGRKWLERNGAPVVLKADGLAGGKGVFVCRTAAEAEAALMTLFEDFGAASVVAEEMLTGPEASYIVATDGERIVPFAPAHDYKRIGDNDAGPNTGGMGVVCPTPHLSSEQAAWACDHVIAPVLSEMKRRGVPFRGFLYAGLMLDPQKGIKVLEFNVRFGDPECQAVLPRLESDLAVALATLADGAESGEEGRVVQPAPELSWRREAAVTVVIAAEGYPSEPTKGDVIEGLGFATMLPGVVVFHAGTERRADGTFVTNGGRVLNVTALGEGHVEARDRAYKAVDMIQFRGRQVRRDIGRVRPGGGA
jgi:phosphoribosylamine--glycine ligase